MQLSTLLALAASLTATSAQILKGFNYGAVNTDQSPVTESQFEDLFKTAQNLVGTSGFSSGRIFTLIQAGTTNTPTEAIQAAINTKTSLLLGLWASAGQAGIDNELAAMKSALSTYGSAFTDLIIGISVGSEDLYRISPTGIENKSNPGASPGDLVNYINQVRNAIKGTGAASKPVGHVDTWTAWVNGSNAEVISAVDFIGNDFYPYFQTTMANSIGDSYALAISAYDQTVAVAQGKPVWVTETGFPVSGSTSNLAVPSLANAKTYWDEVGCGHFFGKVNTWWYTLQDASPTTPNPSFGVVGTELSTTPLFDLTCSGSASKVPSSATAVSVSKGGATEKAGSPGSEGEASAVGGGVATAQTGASSPEVTGSTGGSSGSTGGSSAEGGSSPAKVVSSSCSSETVHVTVTVEAPSTFVTQASSAPESTGSSCPANLNGEHQYPHLIVPVDKAQPNQAGGTSYFGVFSSTKSSIFNFDIPESYSGKTCSLVFLLPTQSELQTSSYILSGSGGIDVARLTSVATEKTSYDTTPAVAKDFGGPSSVTPGNSYVVGSGPCLAGRTLSYEVTATGSLDLKYFQDYNPSPIGLYVTAC